MNPKHIPLEETLKEIKAQSHWQCGQEQFPWMVAPGKLTLTCLDDRCGEVYSLPFLVVVV